MNIVRAIYMEMKAVEKWEFVGRDLSLNGTDFSVLLKDGLLIDYVVISHNQVEVRSGLLTIPIRLRRRALIRKMMLRQFLAERGLGEK